MKYFTLLFACLLSFISVFAQSPDPSQYEDMIKNMLSGMGKVTTIPEYRFPFSLTMNVKTFEEAKENSNTNVKLFLNNESKIFAVDGSTLGESGAGDMITVFDNKNSGLLIFNQKEKSLMAMNLGALKSMGLPGMNDAKKDSAEKENIKCSKTGKTKSILGYSCSEYSCKADDDESKTSIWISEEANLGDLGYLSELSAAGGFGNTFGIKGTVLAMENYSADGKLATSMTVTEINKSANLTIKTSDYQLQQMPMMGN